jgi:hypothetical protein
VDTNRDGIANFAGGDVDTYVPGILPAGLIAIGTVMTGGVFYDAGVLYVFDITALRDLSVLIRPSITGVAFQITTRSDIVSPVAPAGAALHYCAPFGAIDPTDGTTPARSVVASVPAFGLDPPVDTVVSVEVLASVQDALSRGETTLNLRIVPTGLVDPPPESFATHLLWSAAAADVTKRPTLAVRWW